MSPFLRALPIVCLLTVVPTAAHAQSTTCRFAASGNLIRLLADCVTDHSLELQDGFTLDGDGHVIMAVDPRGGYFRGAVIMARGAWAAVINTTIRSTLLANVCPDGEARLRGIYFNGASGEIRGNTVDSIHRVPSGCEEGNGIEVRNRDLDGDPTQVVIQGNSVDGYQKTGIVVHGNVNATIQSNLVGSSVAQHVLAPNGLQVGPIATARIVRNDISGTFAGVTAAGSAILLMKSGAGTLVEANTISGDPDVGIHVFADNATVAYNIVRDSGPDGAYDVGIVNLGTNNAFISNSIVGFRTSMYGVGSGAPAGYRGQQIEE